MNDTTSGGALLADEALAAEGAKAPRVSLQDVRDNIAEQYTFILGDALRAMGMPASERTMVVTVCAAVTKAGHVEVATSAPAHSENFRAQAGAAFAFDNVVDKLWPLMGYALRERLGYSDGLREAIRLESTGLPAGRMDVNPTSVPVLRDAPQTYGVARSASFDIDAEGLVDPTVVAAAWEDVRRQVAEADPPFPQHLIGYTVGIDGAHPADTGKEAVGILTVYG